MSIRGASQLLSKDRTTSSDFMPQLEAMRCLGIIAIVYTHYLPRSYWAFDIYWGALGVKLFFVLTGFLTTRSTLLGKNSLYPLSFLSGFILRRLLRIYFPLLLILVIAYAAGSEVVQTSLSWHLSFISNIFLVLKGAWHGEVSHLWYIAADLQIMIIVPLFLLITPQRYLILLITSLASVAILFRVFWRSFGLGDMGAWVLPFGYLDCFAAGAFLALLWQVQNFHRYLWALGCVGFGVFILSRIPIPHLHALVYYELESLGPALFFMALVGMAAKGFNGFLGILFNSPIFVYIGMISYGIYLIHPFVPGFVYFFINVSPLPCALISLLLTIFLASIMFYLIERPLIRVVRRWIMTYFPKAMPLKPSVAS